LYNTLGRPIVVVGEILHGKILMIELFTHAFSFDDDVIIENKLN